MIAMTTYERPGYLTETLRSLRATGHDAVVFDDCSESKEKAAELDTCGCEVRRQPHRMGTYVNGRQAMQYAYDNTDGDYFVYCQDDVEFSPGWYDEAVRIAGEIDNLAILSPYNYRFEGKGEYHVIRAGHPGAVCWIVRRDFWREFTRTYDVDSQELLLPLNDRIKRRHKCHLLDWKICKCAHTMGYNIAVTTRSYVQHVGDRSTLSNKSMAYTRSKFYE